MKKGNQKTLAVAIEEYLKSFRMDGKLAEVRAISAWEKLMGPAIAKHTKSIFIKNKILYISFDSAVLREELSYAKDKIKAMLNKEAGMDVIAEVFLS
jgi:predicted nucleic acid-binding Zn ribbon protein